MLPFLGEGWWLTGVIAILLYSWRNGDRACNFGAMLEVRCLREY
ncbi:MAG: hypothetical protein SAJ12_09795 [Jaaginema sp. PMC 1079.18]|nr:hypothetical protein [Jaaginema sp. PMC 1080.18]MEC4851291.1 hypothetical protein [Jaaginema sp. PMC 1079.18]MEC4865491.1 hypothetical protein [Jaaginema sp. PMC 1078.18]